MGDGGGILQNNDPIMTPNKTCLGYRCLVIFAYLGLITEVCLFSCVYLALFSQLRLLSSVCLVLRLLSFLYLAVLT